MVEISRRRFLSTTSLEIGVAVAAAAAIPTIALAQSAPAAPPTPGHVLNSVEPLQPASVPDIALLEPMVVHVRDVATAEIAVLIGTQEFIYRDPELVGRLVQTARLAADTEG